MNTAGDLPTYVAVLVAVLLLVGSGLTLTGALGMLRVENFYQRVHAPTLGTSFGAILTLLASIIYFSVVRGAPILHEILIFVFLSVTTPVSLMLLVRAGLHRDQLEGAADVPPRAEPTTAEEPPQQRSTTQPQRVPSPRLPRPAPQ